MKTDPKKIIGVDMAFSQKLADNNEVWDEKKKNSYERKYPFIFFKTALYDWKEIYNKVIRKRKK